MADTLLPMTKSTAYLLHWPGLKTALLLGTILLLWPLTSTKASTISGATQKLTVYQGVAMIVPGGAGDSMMEIGNAGRDIISSGDIFIRPNKLATGTVDYAKFYVTGGKVSLRIPGELCFGDNTCQTTAGGGGSSPWIRTGTDVTLATPTDRVGIGIASLGSVLVTNENNPLPAHSFVNGEARLQVNNTASNTNAFSNTLILRRSNAPKTHQQGILFVDGNSMQAAIRAKRIDSDASYDSSLLFYTQAHSNVNNFQNESSARMVIDPWGKVGIGKTDPGWPLEVYSGTTNPTVGTQITASGTTGGADRLVGYNMRVDGTNLWQALADAKSSSATHTQNSFYLQFNGSAANRYLAVTTAGNIGIGQTTPTGKLVVNNGLSGQGGSGDAIASYADSADSALYAEQLNPSGYAGYFSGKVGIGVKNRNSVLAVNGDLELYGTGSIPPAIYIGTASAAPFDRYKFVYQNGNGLFMGYHAGYACDISGLCGGESTGIGTWTFSKVTTGSGVAVGNGALANLTTGRQNVAIGNGAMLNSTTAWSNVIIGEHAGFFAEESNSVIIGNGAGTEGDNNSVIIGAEAGTGYLSGGNVLIGYKAGSSLAMWSSNKLVIHNNSGPNNLIYGDFALSRLGIGLNLGDPPTATLDVSGEARVRGISGDGTGKAVCVKADGNLGTCGGAVNASGVCACN